MPRRRQTATLMVSLSRSRPRLHTGTTCDHAAVWGEQAARRRALSTWLAFNRSLFLVSSAAMSDQAFWLLVASPSGWMGAPTVCWNSSQARRHEFKLSVFAKDGHILPIKGAEADKEARKHGDARSEIQRIPRPPMRTGSVACVQASPVTSAFTASDSVFRTFSSISRKISFFLNMGHDRSR